jgi:hypothetical protein
VKFAAASAALCTRLFFRSQQAPHWLAGAETGRRDRWPEVFETGRPAGDVLRTAFGVVADIGDILNVDGKQRELADYRTPADFGRDVAWCPRAGRPV